MILELYDIGFLVAVSACVAALVELAKGGIRLAIPRIEGSKAEPLLYRLLAMGLGVVLVLGMLPTEGRASFISGLVLGILAGAASEVVYRWFFRKLLPRILSRVGGEDGS